MSDLKTNLKPIDIEYCKSALAKHLQSNDFKPRDFGVEGMGFDPRRSKIFIQFWKWLDNIFQSSVISASEIKEQLRPEESLERYAIAKSVFWAAKNFETEESEEARKEICEAVPGLVDVLERREARWQSVRESDFISPLFKSPESFSVKRLLASKLPNYGRNFKRQVDALVDEACSDNHELEDNPLLRYAYAKVLEVLFKMYPEELFVIQMQPQRKRVAAKAGLLKTKVESAKIDKNIFGTDKLNHLLQKLTYRMNRGVRRKLTVKDAVNIVQAYNSQEGVKPVDFDLSPFLIPKIQKQLLEFDSTAGEHDNPLQRGGRRLVQMAYVKDFCVLPGRSSLATAKMKKDKALYLERYGVTSPEALFNRLAICSRNSVRRKQQNSNMKSSGKHAKLDVQVIKNCARYLIEGSDDEGLENALKRALLRYSSLDSQEVSFGEISIEEIIDTIPNVSDFNRPLTEAELLAAADTRVKNLLAKEAASMNGSAGDLVRINPEKLETSWLLSLAYAKLANKEFGNSKRARDLYAPLFGMRRKTFARALDGVATKSTENTFGVDFEKRAKAIDLAVAITRLPFVHGPRRIEVQNPLTLSKNGSESTKKDAKRSRKKKPTKRKASSTNGASDLKSDWDMRSFKRYRPGSNRHGRELAQLGDSGRARASKKKKR